MPIIRHALPDNEEEILIESVIKGDASAYVKQPRRMRRPSVMAAHQVSISKDTIALQYCRPKLMGSDQVTHVPELNTKEQVEAQTAPVQVDQQSREALDIELAEIRQQKLAEIESEAADVYEKYKQEGLAAGQKEASAQYAAELKAFKDELKQVFTAKQDLVSHSESGLLDLAIEIAERVIQTQIRDNKTALEGVFSEAVQRITDKDHVVFSLHPESLDAFNAFRNDFDVYFKDIRKLDVRTDASIKVGGIEIETKLGFIDSRVSTKLDVIKKAIYASLNKD
eukprot:COSAG01_NODE_7_length_54400_cov_1218.054935_8_plen_282_part_00